MCEIYKIFSKGWDCDLSKDAMKEMFLFESRGIGIIDISGFNTIGKKPNGYAVGKKWLNVTVAMWFDDMKKHGWYPTLQRLYNDDTFPHWWLDQVFNDFIKNKEEFYKEHGIEFDASYRNVLTYN